MLRLTLSNLMDIRHRLRIRIRWNIVRRFLWNVRCIRFFSDGFFDWQSDRAWQLDDPRARTQTQPIGVRWWHGG